LEKIFFFLKVVKELSKVTTQENGTHQGSVISPILFLLMINDMEEVIPNGVHLSLFADDSATYKSDRNLALLRNSIQQTVEAVKI
jgi:hypothetical protein